MRLHTVSGAKEVNYFFVRTFGEALVLLLHNRVLATTCELPTRGPRAYIRHRRRIQ